MTTRRTSSARGSKTVITVVAALALAGPIISALLIAAALIDPARWSLLLLIQLIFAIGAVGFLSWWLKTQVFDPLRQLADDSTIIALSNSEHQPGALSPDSIKPINDAVLQLSQELSRARLEMSKAMTLSANEAANLNARLEAIVRDLADGLIICNLAHKVVLMNEAAHLLLGDDLRIGLGRNLGGALDEHQLHLALAELQRRRTEQDGLQSVIEFSCPRANATGAPLHARMSLVLAADQECEGYVLILDAHRAPANEDPMRVHERAVIAPRPEFYDFGLFSTTLESPLLDRALDALPITVFDLETTGLKPSQGDEIVQIAGIRVAQGRVIAAETFDRLVNPGRSIPMASTRIHGITNEMVANHPPIDLALKDFETFAMDSTLAAHNAAFDMKCLSMKAAQTATRFDHPVLDTLLLSMLLNPAQTDHSLDALCRRFSVKIEGRHTALGDAQATAEVLIKFLPLLQERGLSTLRDVIAACSRLYEMKSLQSHF